MIKDKMTVRETIHHGNYRNVREMTVAPTWAGWVELLQSSPYSMGHDAENNPYVAKAFAKLLTTGKTGHGWAEFEIIA